MNTRNTWGPLVVATAAIVVILVLQNLEVMPRLTLLAVPILALVALFVARRRTDGLTASSPTAAESQTAKWRIGSGAALLVLSIVWAGVWAGNVPDTPAGLALLFGPVVIMILAGMTLLALGLFTWLFGQRKRR